MKILRDFDHFRFRPKLKNISLKKKTNSDFSYPLPVFHENIKEIELSILATLFSMLTNRRS